VFVDEHGPHFRDNSVSGGVGPPAPSQENEWFSSGSYSLVLIKARSLRSLTCEALELAFFGLSALVSLLLPTYRVRPGSLSVFPTSKRTRSASPCPRFQLEGMKMFSIWSARGCSRPPRTRGFRTSQSRSLCCCSERRRCEAHF